MRPTFRHHAFSAATSAVLASLVIGLGGCDRGNTPDGKAAGYIRNGDFQAAAKEKGASPAIAALAATIAADEQAAASLPAYESLAQQQISISQKLWQLGRLNLTAQRIAASATELNKYKPDAALADLDKTVALIRGNGQKDWAIAEGVSLPTAATSAASVNALKDKISEIKRSAADLKQKRDQLAASAVELMQKSGDATGEQAVALFKQAADARKQASEMSVQVEQTEASLVPLQQDLQVAEDRSGQYARTIDLFAGQKDALEKGWRGVAAQIEQRSGYAAQVYSKVDDTQFASISLTARELSQLTDEYAKQSQDYQQQLEKAASLVRDAVSSSEKTLAALRMQGISKGSPLGALADAAFDPSAARVLQGQIQYGIGSELGTRASLTAFQSRLAENIAQFGAGLNQAVPDSLNDAARAKFKTDLTEQLSKGSDSLKAAGETFDTVMQAMAATPETKRAATIGRMITLADSATVALTAGEAALAKQALDEARALRDSLLQSGPLPGLPALLSGGAAAAPAAAPATGEVAQ